MIKRSPKAAMLLFGFAAIGGLAIFLMLYEGTPGPLSSPHAAVIGGSTIFSCKQCHAEEGLAAGCLHCHTEIAAQLDAGSGYHAFLLKNRPPTCEACHAEHLGAAFPLVNERSWGGESTNTFDHPHIEFSLSGKHDQLACDQCHAGKLSTPFVLPDFPLHPRATTMLGLRQDCLGCHEDVHKSGESTRDCLRCHDQNAFKPAPNFNHDTYFVLEGVHAKAACSACHQAESETGLVNKDGMAFGPVKGKSCASCHETPHRFQTEPSRDCQACHVATDESWLLGRRGIDPSLHATFGFSLAPPHADRACEKCHNPELPYNARYPDPAVSGYQRFPNQCRTCHADPHGGQFSEKHPSCLECHRRDSFVPSTIGPVGHSKTYPLQGAHRAVSCIQCHAVDPASDVRTFTATPTACKACHADPHRGQFDATLAGSDCTACHLADSSSFRIPAYDHRGNPAFFVGKQHREAACQKCHVAETAADPVVYAAAPTGCANCHTDVHRGQFALAGQTDCSHCHGSTAAWKADTFVHDRDARFVLAGSHAKVACAACHPPVEQPDGQTVVHYRPLSTRCEDCHGFIQK
jgi:hypothetical protein